MQTPTRPGAPRSSYPRSRPESTPPVAPRDASGATLSWRAVTLLVVAMLALAVLLPSLRAYVHQQEELSQLRAEDARLSAEVVDLQAELERWSDSSFVIAQARERLLFVLPGETPFRVTDPEVVVVPGATAAEGSGGAEDPSQPWFDALWGSLERADGGAR